MIGVLSLSSRHSGEVISLSLMINLTFAAGISVSASSVMVTVVPVISRLEKSSRKETGVCGLVMIQHRALPITKVRLTRTSMLA